jgi:aromatic-amino-acid transaminase
MNTDMVETPVESPFHSVTAAPPDPILGLTEAFRKDTHENKVNLGVGVYLNEQGVVPVLACVHEAEARLLENETTKSYLPIDGDPEYNRLIQELLLGKEIAAKASGRALTVQALGGTGALRIGADFLRRFLPDAAVYLSAPSWENHAALFEAAGFTVRHYPYYDAHSHGVNFTGMMEELRHVEARSIVVLHVCCHNPTGVDLTQDQWREVVEVCQKRGVVPFLDFAYQGFAEGTEPDAFAVRLFAESGLPCLIANSFSKSFSLYRERIGGLTLLTEDADEAKRVLSQVKRVVRTNYSNPSTCRGTLVLFCDSGECSPIPVSQKRSCIGCGKRESISWIADASAWPR